ncbi:hypothetical protein [Ammoniphilus resinae]|uniref:Zn ribbon nucleic-acid-binding protein n=1 Tax=Ammoniphilus resinae TaxID=861532 RepID=A0ABS4GPG9_9BACL|nr:hypothetical protein [Ammoniphilus resinae]MBP1931957.1 Zn ribbon nucleic-acid-binding protein [Ammoniphilus resinae]
MGSVKKTTDQFKDEVKSLVGSEYTVLGEYTYALSKIKMKHNLCGFEYSVTPAHFLTGNRCPKCAGKMTRTTNQYKKEIFDLVGNDYAVLGEYEKAAKKILICHNSCGHMFDVSPNSFLRGSRCPKCWRLPKKTTEEFKKEIFSIVGDEYSVLGEYKGESKKVKIQHNVCGSVYEKEPSAFINRGERCRKCFRASSLEDFKNKVRELVQNEYIVLLEDTPYIFLTKKVDMFHTTCGHHYKVTPANFLKGSRCPRCVFKPDKTTEQFKQEVFDLVGVEYQVLSDYEGAGKKIKITHFCGYEYEIRPIDFLKGRRCSKCQRKVAADKARRTHEQFLEEVKQLVGDEYTVIGKYSSVKEKVFMQHNQCGYKYSVTPSHFLGGTRCPNCFGKIKKSTETFIEEVFNLVGDEYSVLGEYKTARKKIEVMHNDCGYNYNVVPDAFLRGSRCPSCSGRISKTDEEFRKEFYEIAGVEYDLLSTYVNTNTSIKIKHNVCGYEYEVKPYNFLNGYGCGACAGVLKKDTDTFKKEVFKLVGDEYQVIGEYVGARSVVKMKHMPCGFEYDVIPTNFLRGKRCFYVQG